MKKEHFKMSCPSRKWRNIESRKYENINIKLRYLIALLSASSLGQKARVVKYINCLSNLKEMDTQEQMISKNNNLKTNARQY